MEDRCVFCGDIIPEGRQVCPTCERLESGELKNPCYPKCNKRNAFCHLTCKEYKEWSSAIRKVNDRKIRLKDKTTRVKKDKLRY